MKFQHKVSHGARDTVIEVEGLEQPVTLFHITDSHIHETDEREREAYCEAINVTTWLDTMANRIHLQNALQYANEKGADCTVLTGDIIHLATVNNFDYLQKQLATLHAPFLYTLGNHDWEYPYRLFGEESRKDQYPKFEALTNGSPAYQAKMIKGVKLIALDNSTYQISDEQLDFFRKQLADGLPCLLFMHIPVYVPSLLKDVMAKWGSPIMMAAQGWDPELQSKWSVEDTWPSTQAFYDLLMDNPHDNLIGIFCGHIHFAHSDAFGKGSWQYVTQNCFEGGYRVIRLLPMLRK